MVADRVVVILCFLNGESGNTVVFASGGLPADEAFIRLLFQPPCCVVTVCLIQKPVLAIVSVVRGVRTCRLDL